MKKVLDKIQSLNPSIKIIFYDWDSVSVSELENYGQTITDLHDLEKISACLK